MVATPILPAQMQGVSVHRRGQRLLGPVDLTIGRAGITVLLGPNGAGKTTLLRALHGIQRLSGGQVEWAGPDPHLHQSFVFQHTAVLRRSVLDNIAYPLQLTGTPRHQAREQAAQAGHDAGLGLMLDRSASDLSGGERQKLAIARARIRDPQLLILDEPCASLDPRSTAEIETLLRQARDQGTRIVLSTHLLEQAKRLADEVIFLQNGRVTEQKAGPDFFANPSSKEAIAYLNGELLT